eukprot:TRINITY_DN379_c3_g1_i1.p1 TRINITY_DN379_c3_g1~~TRINITY_DN379_c3_g1_i1.p1  ORF type:complete len:698 (+),score=198.53 TRINITY_DN379_c3_g1_i1:1637-3730(+)
MSAAVGAPGHAVQGEGMGLTDDLSEEVVEILAKAKCPLASPDDRLLAACAEGHADLVWDLCQEEAANPNCCSSKGTPAFVIAALQGQDEVIHKLIRLGVLVSTCRESDGINAPFAAAGGGHPHTLVVLKACGADLDMPTKIEGGGGATPIFVAAGRGNLDCIDTLHSLGADITRQMSNGMTPIFSAAIQGQTTALRKLASLGLDVSARMSNGTTAAFFAAYRGHSKTLETLHELGAEMDCPLATGGGTPIFVAAQQGHTECVSILGRIGCDPEVRMPKSGATPLFSASQKGHTDVVTVLLRDFKVNPNVGLTDSTSPLWVAAASGHVETIKVLAKHGAMIDAPRQSGSTPFCAAAMQGHVDCLRALHELGASPNAKTQYGATALYLAAQKGQPECIKTLVAMGADPDTSLPDGASAVLVAAELGYDKCISVLADVGADLNACRTSSGASPLFVASQKGNIKAMEVLISLGAKVNGCRKDNASPLHPAAYFGRVEACRVLFRAGADVNHVDGHGNRPVDAALEQCKAVERQLREGDPPPDPTCTPTRQQDLKNVVDLLSKMEQQTYRQSVLPYSQRTPLQCLFAELSPGICNDLQQLVVDALVAPPDTFEGIDFLEVKGQPKWDHNLATKECMGCSAGFGLLLRRHHCRACGHLFCAQCSTKTLVLPFGKAAKGQQRVCNWCYESLTAAPGDAVEVVL